VDDKHDLAAVCTGRFDGASVRLPVDCPAPCVLVLRLTAGETASAK